MARPQKISLSKRGKNWSILFRAVDGKQERKSLKTDCEDVAEDYKKEMIRLTSLDLPYRDKRLADVDPFIYEMYYKDEFVYFLDEITLEDKLIKTQMRLLHEIKTLKEAVIDPETGKSWKEKYKALSMSIEAQNIIAAQSIPATDKVLEHYADSVRDLHQGGVKYINFMSRFLSFIQFDYSKKISAITVFQINKFLLDDIKGNKDKNKRWNKSRISLTKFFNWACSQWPFLNPMDMVKPRSVKAQEDILWHSREDIEELLKGKSEYWRAVIGVMAYAGLSAHELRGLRTEDVIEDEGTHMLRVSPNEDRQLKTAKRKRSVVIHKKYLLPLIQEYLSHKPESLYLFPPTVGNRQIWHEDTFSKYLCGTKATAKKKAIVGILPKGYNALSLRRTFGSLLIRSGKSEVEVAAAMGNSPEMVRKHYARILGKEISVNF